MRECDFMRERSGAGCEGFFRGQLMMRETLVCIRKTATMMLMMMFITIIARD